MIGMSRHALVEVGGRECQNNGAHPVQVVDAKLTRPVVGGGCGPDLASFYQGFDNRQLAVWGAFLHAPTITYCVNLSNRLTAEFSAFPAWRALFSVF